MQSPRPDHNACRAAIADLQQSLPGLVETGEGICRQHAHTLTWIECQPPDAVVFARSTVDVVEVVRIAARHRVPIIPFGAGTSLEGHVNAPLGGISLDLSRMSEILRVDTGDLDCTVEAGCPRGKLNAYLRDTGLFFPVDPGTEEATIGGMASTRASGTTAVRYGTMRDNVVAVKAVMANGEVIDTASRARKSSAGYDLTRLLVGAEGTLGIITEVTLRLRGVPERVVATVAAFPTLEAACNTTMAAMAMGLGLARIELLDPVVLGAVNAHSGLSLAEVPTLFIEFHGAGAAVEEEAAMFAELADGEGALSLAAAADETERRKLWKARHDALWAVREAWPGRTPLITDVCVPISRLAECVRETEADIEASGLIAPIVGHVGDGNFHAIVMHEPGDPAERGRIAAFSSRLAERAIAMEGTCTGEHGIGQGKMNYLRMELGAGVDVMACIKQALDPDGIFNPGKIISRC
ncbi:MAG: FAD-binding protein [Alphaproteobacteria bacterium]|nr:FAD-binding protein [Alphaproteobacteria bacterium]